MTPVHQLKDRITVEGYLLGENDGTWRHELVGGRIYAMAGASERHNTVQLNVAGAFNLSVADPCRVFSGDMKLRVDVGDDVRFYYPDVFVSCAPSTDDGYVRRDAVLIVEVLSPTTERTDRYEKFAAYKELPMLSEYVLLAQDVPSVEVYRRRANWLVETYGPGDAVAFESIGQTMTVEQIYNRVKF